MNAKNRCVYLCVSTLQVLMIFAQTSCQGTDGLGERMHVTTVHLYLRFAAMVTGKV